MTDIPKELQPRVVALLRSLVGDTYYQWAMKPAMLQEARAIVAELPEPPDPLLEEARKLVAAEYAKGDLSIFAENVIAGKHDTDMRMVFALAGLRRGKEIGRGGE